MARTRRTPILWVTSNRPWEPEGWSAADKFTVVLECAGLNATELSAYCRERGLFPEQVSRVNQVDVRFNVMAAGLVS